MPLALTFDDVLLINPGAVASPGFLIRLDVPAVAILELPTRQVTHYHAQTGVAFVPEFEMAAGFAATRDKLMTPIVGPELMAQVDWVKQHVYDLSPETIRPVIRACAARCWRHEADSYDIADFCAALRGCGDVPDEVFKKLRSNPAFAPYLE
jgi:hypothetical protein